MLLKTQHFWKETVYKIAAGPEQEHLFLLYFTILFKLVVHLIFVFTARFVSLWIVLQWTCVGQFEFWSVFLFNLQMWVWTVCHEQSLGVEARSSLGHCLEPCAIWHYRWYHNMFVLWLYMILVAMAKVVSNHLTRTAWVQFLPTRNVPLLLCHERCNEASLPDIGGRLGLDTMKRSYHRCVLAIIEQWHRLRPHIMTSTNHDIIGLRY